MEKILEKFVNNIIDLGGKLILAFLIIVIGFKVINFVVKKIRKGTVFSHLEKSSQTFIASIISMILKVIVLITAIAILGIPMSTIVAVVGSAGLALGLALQGGLSNIAGGVMIMLFKPFKVGDYIDTPSGNGKVKEINIFHTIIETLDKKHVIVPNGGLSNSVIVNYTRLENVMVELELSVNYNSDIDKVKKVLSDTMKNNKYSVVLENKPNEVVMSAHADSAIKFILRMWVSGNDYWDAKHDLLENIKRNFDSNNIEIPYPQIDVHLDKLK